jgi:tetratricopeptide (TPR) repeat protein
MASIFLSYSHEDRKRAERIANALETAGHQVWWDQHIRAGSRFSKDINEVLKKSDLVVVLWSKASVESIWVQDEAAHGRDNRRLVPVLIDKVDPPLGFRQYHAISYGRSGTSKVVEAVQATLSGADPALFPAAKKSRHNWRLWAPLAALILVIVSATGWWAYRQAIGTSQLALAIEPATGENSPIAVVMADDLVDAMNRFKAGPISTIEILPPDSKSPATYRAQVRLAQDERQMSLDVALSSRNGDRLWSTSLKGPTNSQAELNREAAAGLGAALECDLDLRKRKYDVSHEVRTLYLQGCSRMGDLFSSRDDQAMNAFKQVTQKAPDFAPGWAKLALAEFAAVNNAPTGQMMSNMRWTAGSHQGMARRLDPSLPELYFVEAFNGYRHGAAEALGIIDEGLLRNPDSALLFDARRQLLMHLGRLNEALESAKRAVAIEPLSPTYIESYVLALAYAGQMKSARRELEKAAQDWPHSKAIEEIQRIFEMRWGDPANALRLQRIGEVQATDEGMELFLKARIEPTPANISAALRYYRLQFEKYPYDTPLYIQALGTFGRFDEVYRVLLGKPEAISEWDHYDYEYLFRPQMRPMLADPRFMDLAHRIGILTVWRKSGDWPDFCDDPKLPYDCQKEAAKYPDKAP